MHWRKRVMLPAVPISILYFPPFISTGAKKSSVEPGKSPEIRASQILAAVSRAFKCCCFRPGFGLFFLILVTLISFPVTAERATAVLPTVLLLHRKSRRFLTFPFSIFSGFILLYPTAFIFLSFHFLDISDCGFYSRPQRVYKHGYRRCVAGF